MPALITTILNSLKYAVAAGNHLPCVLYSTLNRLHLHVQMFGGVFFAKGSLIASYGYMCCREDPQFTSIVNYRNCKTWTVNTLGLRNSSSRVINPDDANTFPEWILNVNQPSLRGPAQMLFAHIVSCAPVPAVCQVLWPIQTERNKAKGSKSLPGQVWDGSTCVSLRVCFSFTCPDKGSDPWHSRADVTAPGTLRVSKEPDSPSAHLLYPGDGNCECDQLNVNCSYFHIYIRISHFPFFIVVGFLVLVSYHYILHFSSRATLILDSLLEIIIAFSFHYNAYICFAHYGFCKRLILL